MQMVKGSSPFGRIRPNYLGSPLTDKSYPLLLIRLREVGDMTMEEFAEVLERNIKSIEFKRSYIRIEQTKLQANLDMLGDNRCDLQTYLEDINKELSRTKQVAQG